MVPHCCGHLEHDVVANLQWIVTVALVGVAWIRRFGQRFTKRAAKPSCCKEHG